MTPEELAAVRERLEEFAAEGFAPLRRSDQRGKGQTYLRGLLLDGRRKSMQPMAERLGVDQQGLQQFVSSSTWAVEPVGARLAIRAIAAIDPEAYVIDDTGFPRDGTASPGWPGSTPAPWARSPTARSACRSRRSPTPPPARFPGGCLCPSGGTPPARPPRRRPRRSGPAPASPTRCGIGRRGGWRWTCLRRWRGRGCPRRWWPPTPATATTPSFATG